MTGLYRTVTLLIFAAMVSFTGCTPGSDLKLAKVSGKVTFDDGTPVAGAVVTFDVGDGKNVVSTGKTNADGEFTLKTGGEEGAIIGKNKVTVSLYVNPDGSPITENEEEGMDMEMATAAAEGAAIQDGDGGSRPGKGSPKQVIEKKFTDKKSTPLTVDVPAEGKSDVELKVGKRQK